MKNNTTSYNFSGRIDAYSITNKFKYDYGFVNSKLRYRGFLTTNPKDALAKPKTNGAGEKNKVNDTYICVNWWHVDVYESGIEIWTYEYSDCATLCDPNRSVALATGGQYIKTNCGNTPGGGSAPPPSECTISADSALYYLENATFNQGGDISYTDGIEEALSSGGYRAPRNSDYLIGSFIIGGSTLTYTANFTGAIQRVSPTAPWKWIKFDYANTVQSAGTPNPCVKAETTTTCSTAIAMDSSKAQIDLRFDYKGSFSCATGNVQMTTPKTVYGNGEFYPKL